MATQEQLVKYIEDGLKRGFNIDHIRNVLIEHGHDDFRISEAIKIVRDIPHSETVEEHLDEKIRKKKPNYWPFIIVIVLLVGVIFVLLSLDFAENQEAKETERDIQERMQEVGILSSEIDEKQSEIDAQIRKMENLNTTIEQKEILVQQQIKEINKLNELFKKERKEIRTLMLELVNFILSK